MNSKDFKYSISIILYPILILFIIWLVFWYQVNIDYSIKGFGIRPLKLEGLLGIFTSPFLHGNIQHLYNNTIPLFVLSLALFYFYNKLAWRVIIGGILLSGCLTWCIASSGNHIGASGLIYVLVSFIFFKGIFSKYYRLIALSLVVIFLYGSMIWYVFPIKSGMSWQGHLGGLITGFLFALFFRKQVAKPERYVWESPHYNEADDPFMRHFDENGNFMEHLENDEELDDTRVVSGPNVSINYTYKKAKDN